MKMDIKVFILWSVHVMLQFQAKLVLFDKMFPNVQDLFHAVTNLLYQGMNGIGKKNIVNIKQFTETAGIKYSVLQILGSGSEYTDFSHRIRFYFSVSIISLGTIVFL